MFSMFAAALALGVGGFDPTAALIAVAALVAGAGRRGLFCFALTVMIGAPLLGSILSLTVGSRMGDVDWWVFVPRGRIAAIVGAGLGVTLIVVGVIRLLRRHSPRRTKASRSRLVGTASLLAAGLGFVSSLLIDPTFLAVTVLASRAPDPAMTVALQVIWVLLSQSPLVALVMGVARLGQQPAVDRFQAWWAKIRPGIGWMVTVALLTSGALLVADATWWFSTGHFLLPDPATRR